MGLVQDWTTRHAVYARTGPLAAMLAAQRDPRSFFSWKAAALASERARREFAAGGVNPPFERFHPPGFLRPQMHTDWSISLSNQSTAAGMYPAKFTFDVNATPSCSGDFVVFPVNHAPDAAHPNLVGLNNLYSGTLPANGLCNRTPSVSDNGTAATVAWSYAVSAVGQEVATSPVLSLDGAKVAFVESEAGSGVQPHFHVLAWKNGDGVDSANLQHTGNPKVVTAFVGTAPAAGSGNATDLAFGATAGVSLSSPFVVYGWDQAYVGDDAGNLVRIKDVFCTVSAACTGANPPAPSIDTAWGTNGSVSVGPGSCSGTVNSALTGPVVDVTTGNVYVGCADGKLYGFNSSGTPLAHSPLAVGDGRGTGRIVDPPIVDGVNGFIYVVTDSNGTNAVLEQVKTDLSSPRVATIGKPGGFNLHAPAFNDAYFSSATSANWMLYVQGYNGGGKQTFLYGVTFNADRTIVTGTPGNKTNLHPAAVECSPLTEFLNGSTDRLFLSLLGGSNLLKGFNITSGFPTTTFATATENGGTSGIIVDNVSTQSQASSIYFSALISQTAVKLTQSGLQ